MPTTSTGSCGSRRVIRADAPCRDGGRPPDPWRGPRRRPPPVPSPPTSRCGRQPGSAASTSATNSLAASGATLPDRCGCEQLLRFRSASSQLGSVGEPTKASSGGVLGQHLVLTVAAVGDEVDAIAAQQQRRAPCRPLRVRITPQRAADPVELAVERAVEHVTGETGDRRVGARQREDAVGHGQVEADRRSWSGRPAGRGRHGRRAESRRGRLATCRRSWRTIALWALMARRRRTSATSAPEPIAACIDASSAPTSVGSIVFWANSDRLRCSRSLARVPVEVELLGGRPEELVEAWQALLDRPVGTEQHVLGERLDDGVRRAGHRDRDAERTADRAVLAQQHVEHGLVDLVVVAVVGDDPDLGRRLAEAVDPTLALLESGRVPRQVVVDDGRELLLQVDALAEAVGGDEDTVLVPRRARRCARSRSAGGRRPVTASTSTPSRLGRRARSSRGDVVGGVDEAAEHDRVDSRRARARRRSRPAARAWRRRRRRARRPGRPAPGGARPSAGVGAVGLAAGHDVDGLFGLVQVEHGLAADLVGVVVGLGVGRGRPGPHRRCRGGRAGGKGAQQPERRPPAHPLLAGTGRCGRARSPGRRRAPGRTASR